MRLGLYKNHFFLNDEVEISTLWIDNYKQVMSSGNKKLIDKFQKCTNIKQIRENNITPKTTTTKIGLILEAMME